MLKTGEILELHLDEVIYINHQDLFNFPIGKKSLKSLFVVLIAKNCFEAYRGSGGGGAYGLDELLCTKRPTLLRLGSS